MLSIDLKMSWRNIWRNPRRTCLTIAAISFASLLLVFMLSFQFGSYETMINASVKINTGHIQIQAQDYNDNKDIRKTIDNPLFIANIIEKSQYIDSYTFRGNAFSMVSSNQRTYGVLIVGIDPVKESNVSTIKNLIKKGKYLSENDKDKAIIGKLLAKNLKVTIGDELTILGQAKDGSIAASIVNIKGIYSSGIDEIDRSTIQLPIKTFQNLYSMENSVHEIVINSTSLLYIDKIKKQLKEKILQSKLKNLPVILDWNELNPGLLQTIKMDLISGFIMYIILIIVVAFSILNTFLMAIFERTREFGVLMAIGTSPLRLIKILMMESSFITIIGISIGILVGSMITIYFQIHGIDITGASEVLNQWGISGRLYPRLSIITALSGPVAVLAITCITSLVPALKVRKLKPVEALAYY